MSEASSDTVAAALEGVLNSDADSAPATEPSPDVAEALKGVLNEPGEKPAGATDDEAGDDDGVEDLKGKKTVPYDRLAKVVAQKNELGERLKGLEEKFKTATERETELRTRVGEMEEDSQILGAIKNLYQDEKYRPHIQAIDNALQGIEEEVVEAEEKGDDKAVSKAVEKFEAKTAELDSLLADQRADSLWDKAHGLAKDMLSALPEQYTDEDRSIIGEMWTPLVDWNGIEKGGVDAIPAALNSSLAVVIKKYSTPKGAIAAQTTKEIEERNPEVKVVSQEDAVQGILDKGWAELDKEGKPLMSEDNFASGMAELLRKTREG